MAGDESDYDLAIIGGGINGCGIARDAAGRGWRVFLCDQADLGAGTSSASTKLIHGGLRYLEHHEFRLVREALMEREVLWGIAPHIIRPLRFVLPHHRQLRPAWLLRLGLFLYDHLGGRKRLPPTRTLRLRNDPAGAALQPGFTRGFAYSDCWVEDSRLVVLNARDAADRGATIAPRTACLSAERAGGWWQVGLRDAVIGRTRTIRARALVNAAGPWVADVAASVIRANIPAVRLVQGSHIVVPRLYDHDAAYIFQNADGRVFFVIPYERDFTLIGTTDQDFAGDPAEARISAAEIDYLCRSASAYLRRPVTADQVVWSYSGVRPLVDDGASAPAQATRDYVLDLDAPDGAPALLTVLGGKITTYRRLAEAALARLQPHLPAAHPEAEGFRIYRAPGWRAAVRKTTTIPGFRGKTGISDQAAGWTGRVPLPGGDFPVDGFEALLAATAARFPFVPATTLRRLLRAYGTRTTQLIGNATCYADMEPGLGADLTGAELRYLMQVEWARTAQDVVWRRSRLGLRLTDAEIAGIDDAMRRMARDGVAAAV